MADLTLDDVYGMKVVELKEELSKRHLNVGGNKSVLIARLTEYIQASQKQLEDEKAKEKQLIEEQSKVETSMDIVEDVPSEITQSENEEVTMQVDPVEDTMPKVLQESVTKAAIGDSLQEESEKESNRNTCEELSEQKSTNVQEASKGTRQLEVTRRRLSGHSIKKVDETAEKQPWGSKKMEVDEKPISINTNLLQDIMSSNSPTTNAEEDVEVREKVETMENKSKSIQQEQPQENIERKQYTLNRRKIITDTEKHGRNQPEKHIQEPEEVTVPESTHPVSEIVHVTNLVRPFTLLQLKELLSEGSSIVENGFWIDNIRSNCLAKFSSTENAVNARNRLYGLKWPSTSPKKLVVEFSNQLEMDKAMGVAPEEVPMELEVRRKSKEHITERGTMEHERLEEDGNKHDEIEVVQGNVLEELFRKTDTLPHLYWLPLNEARARKQSITAVSGADARGIRGSSPSTSRKRRSLGRDGNDEGRQRFNPRSVSRRDNMDYSQDKSSRDVQRSSNRAYYRTSRR